MINQMNELIHEQIDGTRAKSQQIAVRQLTRRGQRPLVREPIRVGTCVIFVLNI